MNEFLFQDQEICCFKGCKECSALHRDSTGWNQTTQMCKSSTSPKKIYKQLQSVGYWYLYLKHPQHTERGYRIDWNEHKIFPFSFAVRNKVY